MDAMPTYIGISIKICHRIGSRRQEYSNSIRPGVSEAAAGAAEDVVPLGLLLPLRDAVCLQVPGCVAVGAVAVFIVAVLRGLLGGQNLLEILTGRARIGRKRAR